MNGIKNKANNENTNYNYIETEIIEGLQQVGFTQNDAKVYLTLLKLGVSNPATISEESGIDRARVYDSLKRLYKKNIIEMEPLKRSPGYKARSPEYVFESIKLDLENKLKLTENLMLLSKSIKTQKEELSLWALPKKSHILKNIYQLIETAETTIYLIITPDISISLISLNKIFDKINEKLEKSKKLTCKISFSYRENHKQLITRFLKNGGIFRNWMAGSIMPFGLYLSEKYVIFTILNSVKDSPKYEFGIIIENLMEDIRDGYLHFAEWFLINFCEKEAKLIQKKKEE